MAVSEARGGKRRGWIIAGGAAAAAAGWIFLHRLAGQMLLALALTGLVLPLARRPRSVEIYYKDDMQPMIEDLLNSGIITRAS